MGMRAKLLGEVEGLARLDAGSGLASCQTTGEQWRVCASLNLLFSGIWSLHAGITASS